MFSTSAEKTFSDVSGCQLVNIDIFAKNAHKRVTHGNVPSVSRLFKCLDLAVGNGTIGEECALRIMLMNENNVAVDLSITDEGTYISEFYALTEDMIPRTYDD